VPFQLQLLNDHGLRGTFFVETLFATRFGLDPLSEIVGLIKDSGQEIQLHIHSEWVDEAAAQRGTRLPKRPQLRLFSATEQVELVAKAAELMHSAGAPAPNAFRAGSFAFTLDTLRAVAAHGLAFDSSYNAAHFGLESGLLPGTIVSEPVRTHGIVEYPMTVFRDGFNELRHTQLGACSASELETVLWRALEQGRKSVVLLSHGFELLNQRKSGLDRIVLRRMERLCRFLAENPDCFNVRGFHGLTPKCVEEQGAPLTCSLWQTGHRAAEQLCRRAYR
jgi:hypothetical protein